MTRCKVFQAKDTRVPEFRDETRRVQANARVSVELMLPDSSPALLNRGPIEV